MGKYDRLAELLGLSAKEFGDDAVKVLSKVDNPEMAVALKGKPREQYLKALDEIYGSQAKRASDLGFGDKPFYHGTKQKFDQFKSSRGGSAGKGSYLTENLGVAESFKPEGGAIFKGKVRDSGPIDFRSEDSIIDAAKKLGVESEFKSKRFRSGNAFYDLFDAYEKKHPDLFKDLIGTDREDAFTNALKKEGITSIDFSQNGVKDYAKNVLDPKDIRSSKAAFDPRFKDSPLLMAGGLAGAQLPQTDMSPFQNLKNITEGYESAKNKLIKPVIKNMNLGDDPTFQKVAELAIGAGIDPLTYLEGPIGYGINAIQGLSSIIPSKKGLSDLIPKSRGLNETISDYKTNKGQR